MKVVERKSLAYAEIILYENGIFHSHILGKTPLSIEQAKEINALRETFLKSEKALVLSTSEDSYFVLTKEAEEYLQSKKRLDSVKANAFVIKSFSQRLAIKAIKSINKLSVPIAYFGTEEEAIKWLLKIKD